MKRFHILICMFVMLVSALPIAAHAEPTDHTPYTEPTDSAPAISLREWGRLGSGLHLTWASKDRHYARHEVPGLTESATVSITAWKGERVCLQGLAFTKKALKGNYSLDWTCSDGKALTEDTEVAWVRYVKADDYEGCSSTTTSAWYTVADMLDAGSTMQFAADEVRPLWASLEVSRDAKAGKKVVQIDVKTDGKVVKTLRVNLQVLDRQLPEPKDYQIHLDLWQQPYSVARYYGVTPWSDAHIELLRPYMKRLARAGQKVVTAILFDEPWGAQSNDNFNPMIQSTLQGDGTWSFDYTVFDRYVTFMAECGIDEQIDCYSILPWTGKFKYYDAASQSYKTYSVNISGTLSPQTAYSGLATSLLQDFKAHLEEKGWFGKTCIAMDERGNVTEAMEFVNRLGFKAAMAGGAYNSARAALYDYSLQVPNTFGSDIVSSRRAAGRKMSVYVSCDVPAVNMFTHSTPAESAFLPIYAAAIDVDGILHWSWLNWTDDPLTDTRFRLYPAGDTYFFYPGVRPSVRHERLLEGIQQFEKIKIMRSIWEADTTTYATQLSTLNSLISTAASLPDIKDMPALVDAFESLLNSPGTARRRSR